MLEGSILQKLEAAHQSGQVGKRPLNLGVYYKNTLVALCHALEDCMLTADSSPLVITAFQQGKWYLEEADRYGELAKHAQQIVIMAGPGAGFAEHPTSQRTNVALVELDPTDPVAQEWNLVILSATYTAMVLCQELSAVDYGPQGPPAEDRERKFYGFWTFEAGLVRETVDLMIDHAGRYNLGLQRQLATLASKIAAESQTTTSAEVISDAVFRVVEYLQTSQQALQPIASELHLDHNLVSNELQAFLRMAQLIDLADATNPMAAAEVAALTEMTGQLLDLPAWQIQRLRLASLLHRLGPLQVTQSVFSSSEVGSQEAPSSPLSCPLRPGVQALRILPQLAAIAQIITHQTEWWNGSGQPSGLAQDKIPLESRILGLVAKFQQQVTRLQAANQPDGLADGLAEALAECQAGAGDRWDPKLVDALALLVSGLQQGMGLTIKVPKMAAGMWLLDPQNFRSERSGQTTHKTGTSA